MNEPPEPFMHWCEVCGIEELLTSEEAFRAGWDFPPRSGSWGVVGPRTCGKCPMTATVWWAVTIDGYDQAQLRTQQRDVIARIMGEVPETEPAAQDSCALSEQRDQLDLSDGGSWLVVTRSGSGYLFRLDGDVRTVVRLVADGANARADERTVMRRDGEVLPLLGLIEPPIQVGRPAYLVVGNVSDDVGYVSTTRATTPVVSIRRLG
ncbi:hypothetical protein [Kocuria massiliensis]|uniref:hypothetical protein n=1 Tax=Kocuria massiliensis TaxID=1926282 RepID=UPI0015A73937|nr:hypothetical protein [Kocuria massiliensis]